MENKKSNTKGYLYGFGFLFLVAGLIFYYFTYAGNPFTKMKVDDTAIIYLDEKYPNLEYTVNDFIATVHENNNLEGYVANIDIINQDGSSDNFGVYIDKTGENVINDDYEFLILNRYRAYLILQENYRNEIVIKMGEIGYESFLNYFHHTEVKGYEENFWAGGLYTELEGISDEHILDVSALSMNYDDLNDMDIIELAENYGSIEIVKLDMEDVSKDAMIDELILFKNQLEEKEIPYYSIGITLIKTTGEKLEMVSAMNIPKDLISEEDLKEIIDEKYEIIE